MTPSPPLGRWWGTLYITTLQGAYRLGQANVITLAQYNATRRQHGQPTRNVLRAYPTMPSFRLIV